MIRKDDFDRHRSDRSKSLFYIGIFADNVDDGCKVVEQLMFSAHDNHALPFAAALAKIEIILVRKDVIALGAMGILQPPHEKNSAPDDLNLWSSGASC